MIEQIKALLENKSVVLLGFGREGQSTYTLIRRILPEKAITLLDENDAVKNNQILQNDTNLTIITGKGCWQTMDQYDLAIKSPGIPSNELPGTLTHVVITSQTDIFLTCFGKQVIGITGTKGKSTTASLTYHILKNSGRNTLLVGNIGIPPFDCIDEIKPDTTVVMELSSHQLEYVSHSPHIGILLNIFQEHLDHYYSYEDYQWAKFNIGKFQNKDDFFIYNCDNEILTQLIKETTEQVHKQLSLSLIPEISANVHLEKQWIELTLNNNSINLYDTRAGQPLQGHHNLYNIMAAATACYLIGVSVMDIDAGIKSFHGLEHRIELVGTYNDIIWYNDSIATIPEATIEAIKTLNNVDTLILGGFDRGIEYGILYPFLSDSGVTNIIFIGEAGARMKKELSEYAPASIQLFTANDYMQVIEIALSVTTKGKICLLSPAAASYDMFRNFEERGNVYKKNVRELAPHNS